jgi:hypothetical protein
MKLSFICERKTAAYKNAVRNGTESFLFPDYTILRLTTPEAVQHYSRKTCPDWQDGENDPVCTVVFQNAVDYLSQGPIYLLFQGETPIIMGQPGISYYSYLTRDYFGWQKWAKEAIDKTAQSLQSKNV